MRTRAAHSVSPEHNSLDVHPGELMTIVYDVTNGQGRPVVAQAIPSYAPKQATEFFKKIECFCFTQQTLAANESRKMPVVFVIDPKLPKDVKTITLSYTFELNTPATPAPAPGKTRRRSRTHDDGGGAMTEGKRGGSFGS